MITTCKRAARRAVFSVGRVALVALVCVGCSGESSSVDSAIPDAPVGNGSFDLGWPDGLGGADAGGDFSWPGDSVAPGDTGVASDVSSTSDAGSVKTGVFVKLAAGSFKMGSPASESCRNTNETQHDVTLTRAFEISNTEVTQGEFNTVMKYNPAANKSCGTRCPVESASWHEAAAYCNALSTKKGVGLCYDCTGSQSSTNCKVKTAYSGAGGLYKCPGYRLPTEAEWEYAYRAGTTTALYNGAVTQCTGIDANASAIGWYIKNSSDPKAVALKKPNAKGLYDMAGNVMEWVHDQYVSDLGAGSVTDPVAAPGSSGVIRGGSFAHPAEDMRAAFRQRNTTGSRYSGIGFRCVRTR